MSRELAWHALEVDPRALSVGRDFEVFSAKLAGAAVIIKAARGQSDTPAREAQLLAESQALELLARSGVAPVAIGHTRLPGGRLGLVRSYIAAPSLATLIERSLVRHRWQGARRWNAPTRDMVAALLDAVERVHAVGLVHNDLKPDDILIGQRAQGGFEVTLIDFGLAARERRGGPGGTVTYAAPERLEGEAGSVASDIWALGAIVFEMLAGTRAYACDQPVDARLERRMPLHRSTRESVVHAWRQLPEQVQQALAAALEPDPRRRPRSVAALRKALGLRPVRAVGLGARPSRPTRDDAKARSSRAPRAAGRARRLDPALFAALVATVLAVVLAWGPVSRALGLERRAARSDAACAAVQRRAAELCRGLSGELACRAALTATDDCDVRAELLGACEAP